MRQTTWASDAPGALPADLGAEVSTLLAQAEYLLDRPFVDGEPRIAVPAKLMLDRVWSDVMSELSAFDPTTAPQRTTALMALLTSVRDLDTRIGQAEADTNLEVLRSIQGALSRLHAATTLDDLFSRAAQEACTIGFDRVLVSSVDRSRWNLHTMHIEQDPRLAIEMVEAGKQNPPTLDGTLVESDIVARGESGLVYDVQDNPRVDRRLVSMSGCTSYGIAPITVAGRTVGLVHADAYYARRPVTTTDRSVLGLFAEGLGHAVARVMVVERVSALTSTLHSIAGGGPATSIEATPPHDHGLSNREIEVLEAMASGSTNRFIARQLSISEGTVKTHITHILRKLDASNRAEAVAFWLRR